MNVLVVDMIEGFTRTGALASPRVEALIPKQVEFLKSLPSDAFIVFACDAHGPSDYEFKRMPVHCMAGSKEAEICPELLEAVSHIAEGNVVVVPKRTHSAFFGTNFDEILKMEDLKRLKTDPHIDDWTVIGCVTDVCVAANVMELDYRGKNVTVYADLVDTYEITASQSVDICGNMEKTHDPDIFNNLFFDYYLPGVWGVKVLVFEDPLVD